MTGRDKLENSPTDFCSARPKENQLWAENPKVTKNTLPEIVIAVST